MAKYVNGEIVDIVGGTCKKYKTGTYQRKAGLTMATVLVHGLGEPKNIRWTSIQKRVDVDTDVNVDTKQVLQETLVDIEAMAKRLQKMKLNVENALKELD